MQKDESTWLNIALIFTALLFAALVWRFLHFVAINYNLADGSEVWFGPTIIFAAIAIGGGAAFMLQYDQERREYLLGSIGELRKVMWPSWDVTRKLTTIVCVVVAVFAVILSIFDLFWAKILQGILS